ncbi:hypothetical protein BGZ88_006287 [Linnemannia elongata]|nr:hypothetical protein BGZ88_006287 [Linnemannia elongata]
MPSMIEPDGQEAVSFLETKIWDVGRLHEPELLPDNTLSPNNLHVHQNIYFKTVRLKVGLQVMPDNNVILRMEAFHNGPTQRIPAKHFRVVVLWVTHGVVSVNVVHEVVGQGRRRIDPVRVINAANYNPANDYKVFITQLDEKKLVIYEDIFSFYDQNQVAINTPSQNDAPDPQNLAPNFAAYGGNAAQTAAGPFPARGRGLGFGLDGGAG